MTNGKTERKLAPSLFDVASVSWAWVRRRWNLLWLIPNVVLFIAATILAAAYLPKVAELAAGVGSEEWLRRSIRAASTAALSTAFLVIAWRGSKWLFRSGWQKRAMPVSLLSVVKTGLLVGTIVSFHYGGATQLLREELQLPAVSAEVAMNSICGLPATPVTPASQPLKEVDVATPAIEAAYRELTNSPDKRVFLTHTFQRISWQYACPVKLAALRNDLPTSIIAAVITAESGGEERAVSPKGAKGVMQLMPINYGDQNPFDPLVNVELGSRLLRQLVDEHGDTAPALAHYNASNHANEQARMLAETLGANNFWQRREFLPEETKEYVPKILALQIAWSEWEEYGRVRSFEERHGLATTRTDNRPSRPLKQEDKRPRQYVVKSGDTASAITRRMGVSQEDLKRLNAWLDPKRLLVGQVLRLPSSS